MDKGNTINPIKFAKDVNENFLNYQLTAFPFTDEDLNNQAKELLKGDFENSPMIKGPYVSLSKSFLEGSSIETLIEEGIGHPALAGIAPFPTLFKHQERVFRTISNENHCLVSTGTGSGKTESFLLPIINYCLGLRDEGITDGISAILVYPMNALANDQLDRLRGLLAGSGITFGIYVGSTPSDESKVGNVVRLKEGQGRVAYTEAKTKSQEGAIVSPYEECLTEEEIIARPPKILLTNINQLELLLTRKRDIGMFINAPLKYIVFDEVHTYTGAKGAEVSCLVRRLKSFCGKTADEVICIGTSATISDDDNEEQATQFASRFLGVNKQKVSLIQEEYKQDKIAANFKVGEAVTGLTTDVLDQVLEAIEEDNIQVIQETYNLIAGTSKQFTSNIKEELFDELSNNNYIYHLNHVLIEPIHLKDALNRINKLVGRKQTDEADVIELFIYLALGAFSEKEGNVLLKPKIHYFVKGLEGVVATFNDTNEGIKPVLSMNKEEATNKQGVNAEACFPTLVCSSCGQHYFEGYYEGFRIVDNNIVGAQMEGNNFIFEPADDSDSGRAIFTNKFFSLEDEEYEELVEKKLFKKMDNLYLCRYCGTLHKAHAKECANPKCRRSNGIIQVSVMKNLENNKLLTCPCCGHKGIKKQDVIKYEAIRPLRATAVSDNHILAQNILNEITGENKKLIMFADNRQDAAFQAGWMRDRTRRYRFRHLVYEFLKAEKRIVSIDEIVKHLMDICTKDRELALALAPEVFVAEREEAYSTRWIKMLEKYWRFTVVRELASTFKMRDNLENWGVIKVEYYGISEELGWIRYWADKLHMQASNLSEGIKMLLDKIRRDLMLYDEPTQVFSKQWSVGDYEVQNDFIPYMDFPPKGLVEYDLNTTEKKKTYIKTFRSTKANTSIEEFIKKWGIHDNVFDKFMNELWTFLTEDTSILKKIELKGRKDNSIASNVYQIDSDKVGIVVQNKRYKCNVCQRIHTRLAPNDTCTAWQCKGKIKEDTPKAEDYNINMLQYPFSMVIAKEHSAQVPAKEREEIEDSFKNTKGQVNCLVATPTLEMGVDIGSLDVVLMRNVPPKSANYWQRAGRAGRKYRMAVIYTYCRQSEHDKYFFKDPLQMLKGQIQPPKFNLRNEIMIRKHVHATVLSTLIRMSTNNQSNSIIPEDRDKIAEVLSSVFPTFICDYLFYNNENKIPREEVYDVKVLRTLILKYEDILVPSVQNVFEAYWPEEDSEIVSEDAIRAYIEGMTKDLEQVIVRMYKRMRWAVNKIRSIDYSSANEENKKLFTRCDSFLRKLKSKSIENYTLSVLAMEGFLPGYGVYETAINGYVKNDYNGLRLTKDFELNRPASLAVREFVPGNMIYANGAKYKCSYYHLSANKEDLNLENYYVDAENNIIKKATSERTLQYNSKECTFQALPINDLTLNFTSRIIDEELNRFQMPVNVMGELEKFHSGIRVYSVNGREVKHHFGQKIRLINVGPADRVKEGKMGYPICSVCGATRSPYSSDKEIEDFIEKHKKTCGRNVENLLLYSDSKVDGIKCEGFTTQQEAINFAEAIRIGASIIVEMDLDDLQYIVYQERPNDFSTFIYDPMPGGSGILQQVIESWQDAIKKAIKVLSNCEGKCAESCYNCMRTYRNVFVHTLLDRHLAIDMLQGWLGSIEFSREIPANIELINTKESSGTNRGEIALFEILNKEGFPTFQEQKEINIGPPYNRTIPDLYYEDEEEDIKLAIYLDGLSKEIHGNEERMRIDAFIRHQLEDMYVDVVQLSVSDLDDPETLKRALGKIARKLNNKELRRKYR